MNNVESIDAGAIYIAQGNSFLYKVCGYMCKSACNCAFATSFASPLNSLLDCSISSCEAEEWYITYHQNGNINTTRVNLSNNKCTYTSALYYFPGKAFTGGNVGSIICYCIIANNEAYSSRCIRLYNADYEYEISNSNIINNIQQDSASHGLIYSKGKTTIKNTCIMDNIGSPIFQNTDNEFILINCSLDGDINLYSDTPPTIVQEASSNFVNSIYIINYNECKLNLILRIHTLHKSMIIRFIRQLFIHSQISSILIN